MKKIIVTVIAVIAAILFSGCPNANSNTNVLPETFRITYNGNGNTSGSTPVDGNVYAAGATVTVLDNINGLVKDEETFSGWNTKSDGTGTSWPAGSTFAMSGADITLYAIWLTYSVGDTGPAGGTVFYDKTVYSNGWRYLEAAPVDQSTGIQWYNGSNVTTGTSGTIIGTGKSNTEAIVLSQGDGSYAAKICYDLSLGGYDDWFLPSTEELIEIHNELVVIESDTSFASSYYWSSTEGSSNTVARRIYSTTANNTEISKSTIYPIRAIRSF